MINLPVKKFIGTLIKSCFFVFLLVTKNVIYISSNKVLLFDLFISYKKYNYYYTELK